MKILDVIRGFDPLTGGTAVALEGLAKAQKQAGLDFSICSTNGTGQSSESTAERLRCRAMSLEQVGVLQFGSRRNFIFCQFIAVYEFHSLNKFQRLAEAKVDGRQAKPLSTVPKREWGQYASGGMS